MLGNSTRPNVRPVGRAASFRPRVREPIAPSRHPQPPGKAALPRGRRPLGCLVLRPGASRSVRPTPPASTMASIRWSVQKQGGLGDLCSTRMRGGRRHCGTYLHVQPRVSVLRRDKHWSWPVDSPHFFRNGSRWGYVIASLWGLNVRLRAEVTLLCLYI